MKKTSLILILFLFTFETSWAQKADSAVEFEKFFTEIQEPSLIILGTIQDGGSPHIGCTKKCCSKLFLNPDQNRMVVSIGVIDPKENKKYIFECTPDFPVQAKILRQYSPNSKTEMPDGILLTHGHIGHYSGLMYLGKEAMNTKEISVYAMPRMKRFLETNGPWSQLVTNKNILLHPLEHNKKFNLSSRVLVTPILVPHRDEYSETVGFIIEGPSKKVLFIPDIDKWEKWDKNILEIIEKVDFAFIDGTFYNGEEINTRDLSSIPHPFILESMRLFKDLPSDQKKKIFFIHFNHTNRALDEKSEESKTIQINGFGVAHVNQIIKL